ncbi:hypothetical protein DSO57_1008888 [Entomophthora muscae]|uniref:Uncharacterized protein n=1 Tax=Entomophthora muscae TaxID=34485 RepID=A0ACC2TUI1_9FUNG|nr:hypothetical protein DSO57_1008888 [Entomophthora muscae]
MKPSVAVLICPGANTSMPAFIAEAKRAEKRANIEYAAHNSNCSSNDNGRDNSEELLTRDCGKLNSLGN